MGDSKTLSELIKRYIKMRGRTMLSVAEEIGTDYKTFNGMLNDRSRMSAVTLFQLANVLNMDLEWMAQFFDKRRTISSLEQYQITRMSDEMRKNEQIAVYGLLDESIRENLGNTAEVKKYMIKMYQPMFYLLDVLLPEDYIIKITKERGEERYYCMKIETNANVSYMRRGRNATVQFYDGHEMLTRLIEERKGFVR